MRLRVPRAEKKGLPMAAARKHDPRPGRRPNDAPRAISPAAPPERSPGRIPADPPRPHRGFLIASALAVAAWLGFLLTMALRGS